MDIQVLDPSEVKDFRWKILDLSKVSPHAEAPLGPVEKLILNGNVSLPILKSLLGDEN